MNRTKKTIATVLLFLLIIAIFHVWFFSSVISAGDLNYYYNANFKDYFVYPYAWNWQLQNGSGLGGFISPFGWISFDYSWPIVIGNSFHLNWHEIETIFYFLPFLILCILSPIALYKKIFPHNQFYLLSAFVYILNSYILMMVGGGQVVGISFAYAITPFALLQFMNLIDGEDYSKIFLRSVVTGIIFALLTLFDLRFAYMVVGIIVLYFIFNIKKSWKRIVPIFIIPFGIAGLVNAFWILPVLFSHSNPAAALGGAYNSLQSVQYFSFAKFENTISLLHPNWPENIFGKVYFMRPEFLIIPILAYASLFFITKKSATEKGSHVSKILFFAVLGLIGAFLAKGANDPFGGVYLWMFSHIPGFVMFRDPTKFYVFVALSYSLLLPYSLWEIAKQVSISKYQVLKKYGKNFVIIIFIIIWLFTIRQAVFGQLGGTFKSVAVPSEYISLENFLIQQQPFSRTMWVPTIQRFGFSSQNHPAVSAEDFFTVYDEKSLSNRLNNPATETLFQELGVKYIIVPTDSQKEIFLANRSYSNKLYKQTVSDISKISWLRQIHQFNDLAIFEIQDSKDHFWSSDKNINIMYSFVNPSEYRVSLRNVKKGDRLVFSDSFDSHWIAFNESMSSDHQSSKPYNRIFNSFILQKNGNYTLSVYYDPQRWVDLGVWISLGTIIIVIGSLVFLKKKE